MPKQEQQSAEKTKGDQKKPTKPQAKARHQADCQKSCNKQHVEHEMLSKICQQVIKRNHVRANNLTQSQSFKVSNRRSLQVIYFDCRKHRLSPKQTRRSKDQKTCNANCGQQEDKTSQN